MSVEAVFDSGEIGRRRTSPFALGLQEVVVSAIEASAAVESAVMPRVAAQSVSRGKMTAEQLEARQLQRSEDDELIRAAQAGDRSSFDALVRRYDRSVLRLALHMLGHEQDAQDVHQEAFIKAYRALPQFRGDSAFYTWLYRIAINTAKNAVVSRDRSPIEYDLDRNNTDESYDMQGRMKDPDTPEGLVLTDEIRSTVNSAIEALPEDLRTAIVLRELEGLSYEEIAAAMDCPVGTVRSRIFRAREAIDRRLREVFEGGLGRVEELG